MQIRTTLAAFALCLAPGLALAQGCNDADKITDDTASSCMAGYVWDAATSTCVANPAS